MQKLDVDFLEKLKADKRDKTVRIPSNVWYKLLEATIKDMGVEWGTLTYRELVSRALNFYIQSRDKNENV